MPRAILFDLDGTLVDTRAASWELFEQTNRAFALGIDSRDAFFRVFEGNFFESLARLCPDPQRAEAAKQHFMELLRTRYSPALIPGMSDVVRALAPHCTLALVSANGIETIRRILVNAGIATCFSHVFSGDVQPKKSASIRRFLGDQSYAAQRRCRPEYHDGPGDHTVLDAADVVLVTDTAGDVAEAREAGIRALGVAWGMHTERQLLDAGAEKVALWPQELVAWLRPADGDAAAGCACDVAQPATRAATATPAAAPAKPPRPEPTHEPALAAGRLRREQQLQHRAAPVLAGAPRRDAAPTFARIGAPDAELLQALRRIVGSAA
jgi:phosphoglycolate phosphatase